MVIDKSAPAFTVTVKEHDDILPQASSAVHVTVVTPILNETPFNVRRALAVVAPPSEAVRVKLLQPSVAVAFHELLECRYIFPEFVSFV